MTTSPHEQKKREGIYKTNYCSPTGRRWLGPLLGPLMIPAKTAVVAESQRSPANRDVSAARIACLVMA
jgi:hypothetical protein